MHTSFWNAPSLYIQRKSKMLMNTFELLVLELIRGSRGGCLFASSTEIFSY